MAAGGCSSQTALLHCLTIGAVALFFQLSRLVSSSVFCSASHPFIYLPFHLPHTKNPGSSYSFRRRRTDVVDLRVRNVSYAIIRALDLQYFNVRAIDTGEDCVHNERENATVGMTWGEGKMGFSQSRGESPLSTEELSGSFLHTSIMFEYFASRKKGECHLTYSIR